ncbi:MAG: hypothetical protein NUW01_06740 [Gemmatimonadaceae bacterium]|nr:hypothetical protein [Gemmatimonadaceae bacterium]
MTDAELRDIIRAEPMDPDLKREVLARFDRLPELEATHLGEGTIPCTCHSYPHHPDCGLDERLVRLRATLAELEAEHGECAVILDTTQKWGEGWNRFYDAEFFAHKETKAALAAAEARATAAERDFAGFRQRTQVLLDQNQVTRDDLQAQLARAQAALDSLRSALSVSHAQRHARMFSWCEEGECPQARAVLAGTEEQG